MTYVGIDVSKATFVVAYSSAKTGKTKTFKNTVKGVHEFIQTISASEHHCVLEATGSLQVTLRLNPHSKAEAHGAAPTQEAAYIYT